MKIHRFYFPHHISEDSLSITNKDLVHQLTRVLRLSQGEHIELFDGSGNCSEVEITLVSKNTIEVSVIKNTFTQPPKKHVALFFSILKKENTEYAIEKAVEVGVSEIIPIINSRTVKTDIKHERISSIIKEATEQSGRTYIPVLHDKMDFVNALDHAKKHFERVVVFDPRGTQFQSSDEKSVAIFVGPEGGFTQEELLLAQSKKCEVASLPTHVLRGETAAIISVYTALL